MIHTGKMPSFLVMASNKNTQLFYVGTKSSCNRNEDKSLQAQENHGNLFHPHQQTEKNADISP